MNIKYVSLILLPCSICYEVAIVPSHRAYTENPVKLTTPPLLDAYLYPLVQGVQEQTTLPPQHLFPTSDVPPSVCECSSQCPRHQGYGNSRKGVEHDQAQGVVGVGPVCRSIATVGSTIRSAVPHEETVSRPVNVWWGGVSYMGSGGL